MEAARTTNTIEIEGSTTSRPSSLKPKFAPLKAHEIYSGDVQFKTVTVPPHRYTPLKKAWLDIFTPIDEKMHIDIKFNPKTRTVALKTRHDTPEVNNLQKSADFVHAFTLGFDIEDAIILLKADDFYVGYLIVDEVKRLNGEHLSRAISRLSGKGGKTKFSIENATKTRIVIANTNIYILGSYKNIEVAKHALCSLILGSLAAKVYSKLRAVSARLAERL
ncbi:hypothetical protein RND81_03G062300 [Saponaria officinalis]|uniref:K Homology domain-containing protein n=1 Tax=Saponaria officinalis TaxID=3572 RepID=A0AAW1LYP7_SAPOF